MGTTDIADSPTHPKPKQSNIIIIYMIKYSNERFVERGMMLTSCVALLIYALISNETHMAAAAGLVTGATAMPLVVLYKTHRHENRVSKR